LSSHVAALDPSEVEVDLKVVPTDRIPFWVDLVPAAASHILPTPVASPALSDSSRPLAYNLWSWCPLLQLRGSPPGVGSTAPPPPRIQVRASSSTSGDGFHYILRSPVYYFSNGSFGLPSTVALHGQSTRVYVSSAPLRPSVGGFVVSDAMNRAVSFFRSRALL
jgi:hypothetical protein